MKTCKYSNARRQFLKSTVAATLAYSLLPQIATGSESKVIKKTIPSSAERLSVIGLGTSRTFNVSDSTDSIAPLVELMQVFFDQGGQLIDSSPMYGNAESVTGALLNQVKIKQGLFTATKVWTNGKAEGKRQMQRSMQRMGVDAIDLMQIHNLRDWQTHIETLVDWKAQGKIRYIGLTTSHGRYHKDLEIIMQQQPLDFVQFSYNILDRAAEQRLLPIAQEKGIATLINRPYQRGALFSKSRGHDLPALAADLNCSSWGQFYLKFILGHPAVTCIIPATAKVSHMTDNMQANFGAVPDVAQREEMLRIFASL